MRIALTRQKLTLLSIFVALVTFLIFVLVKVRNDIVVTQKVLIALRSTNQVGVVSAAGTNMLLRLEQSAIPILLRWSSRGRDPGWYKLINPLRKLIKKPPLRGESWRQKEMARQAFAILRERASPAVPQLLSRLSDSDPSVRRISAQMLGAIGPSMGTQALHQMTNCLADPDKDVRNDVVWTVQFHRPEEYPVDTLLAVYLGGLQDSYSVARQNAMIGLTRMGKKAAPARESIRKALSDTDSGVKYMARELLNAFEQE